MPKKFKRVILHVGPDKTGSTAIQNALFQNREFLLSRGVMFSSGHKHNDKLLWAYFLTNEHLESILDRTNSEDNEDLKTKSKRYVKRLLDEIQQSDATDLVLSHEGLVHLDIAELTALRKFLEEFTQNIEVIFYVREPVAYAKSAMSQRVKTGRRVWGVNPPYMRYKVYLGNLVEAFGKEAVKPRVYARELFPGGDVVRDFLSLLPITEKEQLNIVEKTQFKGNPSLPNKGLLVGDRIVELLGKQVPSANKFKALVVPELMQLGKQKIQLSNAQYSELEVLCSNHIQFLKSMFSITLEVQKTAIEDNVLEAFSNEDLTALAKEIIQKTMPDKVVKKQYFSLSFLRKSFAKVRTKLNLIRDRFL